MGRIHGLRVVSPTTLRELNTLSSSGPVRRLWRLKDIQRNDYIARAALRDRNV